MLKRTITGVVLAFLAIPAIVFSETYVLTLYLLFLAIVAGYELLNCVGFGKKAAPNVLTFLYVAALVIPFRMIDEYTLYVLSVTFVYVFLMFAASVLSKGSLDFAVVAEAVACVIYSTLGFVAIACLRDMPYGFHMFILVFLSAFCTDIFAYFVGFAIGRHKLIPEVSPKKTVEGAVGGMLGCVLVNFVYGAVLSSKLDMHFNLILFCLLGVVISIVSQLGDLILSQLKRRHKIKDFGKIFPGHGGVLDRFDSVIAVGFFMYVLWNLLSEIIIT